MKVKYENEFLGLSKPEIRKVWDNTWNEILSLDPMRDFDKRVELNRRFDKCVEAYYSEDCGTYWKVQSVSGVRGKYMTYRVNKEDN